MKAIVETKDPGLVKRLQPIVQLVNNYDGHINASYTHGAAHIPADQMHKRKLCALIEPELGPLLEMGTGGGHIWIGLRNACKLEKEYKRAPDGRIINWKVTPTEPYIEGGPTARVMLIID